MPFASSLPAENVVTYSIMHISDTQSLTTNYPKTLDLTFSHIESMKKPYNISAIIITGDVVNIWNERKEWDAYAHARNLTTIPVYEIAGNHDTDGGNHYDYYTAYRSGPAENYVSSVADFDLVGINYAGRTFPQEELIRLRRALIASSRSHAIIATHYYMDEDGTLSPLGKAIDENLIVKPGLVLMGHMHANFVQERTVKGFPTVADMTNYQDGVPGGTTGRDYSAGTLYMVTSVNGTVNTITVRTVHIYPVPYVEEEKTVFGKDTYATSPECPVPAVTGISIPVYPHIPCCSGRLSCQMHEIFQQSWKNITHVLL